MTQKGEMVERLQVKACSIGKILTNLEKKYNNSHDKDDGIKKSPSGHTLGYNPAHKRPQAKIQMIPPFNANKIKKSPSAEPATAAAAHEEVKEPDIKEEKSEEADE